ncbi:transcriptional regulator, IclR family [Pseudooceanicola antarcticus]|uniref:IclR family transcriptional regulator n=1 Tax=Pseudooceanicola antarcticus TaxID=1247613 RepID=A0A285HU26_9RHOB|nr:IclR family transcriptional regulator C-terminal domain-containing protein [Pseudooceanicola antarcticus]PJE27530.1 IclR family transcriptional regulator [Pseudooceanicola antarcticus]SNY39133.1 transcriptional regulator, IclR family [Pseudooceanicola antarcticus]
MIAGLAKGLRVIEGFTADHPRQSISDVAEATGLDRATARRCLLTLAELGYAAHDGKYFTLTPRVLRLGTACLATLPLAQMVQPWLDQLSEELGESSSVSVLDEGEVVYVARAAQRKVMSIALMPGSRLPAYCTSMGRVLLAALPEDQARARLAAMALEARTPLTVTDPEALMARLSVVRAQGYEVIDQEVEMGLRSIAVPLLDAHGRTIAALNLGLPVRDTPLEEIPARYLPALERLQAELKRVLR